MKKVIMVFLFVIIVVGGLFIYTTIRGAMGNKEADPASNTTVTSETALALNAETRLVTVENDAISMSFTLPPGMSVQSCSYTPLGAFKAESTPEGDIVFSGAENAQIGALAVRVDSSTGSPEGDDWSKIIVGGKTCYVQDEFSEDDEAVAVKSTFAWKNGETAVTVSVGSGYRDAAKEIVGTLEITTGTKKSPA